MCSYFINSLLQILCSVPFDSKTIVHISSVVALLHYYRTNKLEAIYSFLSLSLSHNLHRILGKKKVAELLIRNGVDVNHMDINNQTALHRAASQGNIWSLNRSEQNLILSLINGFVAGKKRVTDLLVKHGAMIDVVDNDGQTPLNLAVKKGYFYSKISNGLGLKCSFLCWNSSIQNVRYFCIYFLSQGENEL